MTPYPELVPSPRLVGVVAVNTVVGERWMLGTSRGSVRWWHILDRTHAVVHEGGGGGGVARERLNKLQGLRLTVVIPV